jgi:hypothetical protein
MVYTVREFYSEVCKRLGVKYSDRQLRKWRSKAFLKAKPFYSSEDVARLEQFGRHVLRTGNLKIAQYLLLEDLNEKQRTIDVQFEPVS